MIKQYMPCQITTFLLYQSDSFFSCLLFEKGCNESRPSWEISSTMTKTLVEDGDKSNATLHILIIRPLSGLHCTLTLTCNPHLFSAFDLLHNVSRVFRGQKARHRQRKCKAGELFSHCSYAPLIQYILTFFNVFFSPQSFCRWKMSAGRWHF